MARTIEVYVSDKDTTSEEEIVAQVKAIEGADVVVRLIYVGCDPAEALRLDNNFK